jgi:hypothetical protein
MIINHFQKTCRELRDVLIYPSYARACSDLCRRSLSCLQRGGGPAGE